MAKIFGKDPVTYSRERDGFLRDLQHFHEGRGTPFRRFPQINGQEIDLYLLYSLVTTQGGWVKVNAKNEWPDLLKYFRLTGKCVNSGVALKQIYLRYLDRWEKVHYLGEEPDRVSDEEDNESNRHKRWSARALHSVPLAYNYHQHNVSETSRENNNLSTDLYKPSDYDRLALSLLSVLPNEQDFAINVCTVLSNDGKHTLKLEKHPRLVDNLLAHAGVYNHSSLRKLFVYYYKHVRKHSLDSFWTEVLATNEFLDLTNENNFVGSSGAKDSIKEDSPESEQQDQERKQQSHQSSLFHSCGSSDLGSVVNGGMGGGVVGTSSGDGRCSDVMRDNCEVVGDNDCDDDDMRSNGAKYGIFRFKIEPEDADLFCLGRTLGTQDYIGQRVLQIAQILRNLSFIEDNIATLSNNRTFMRFLLLCSNAKWSSLQSLGLDMLGNIASDFLIKERNKDRLADCLLKVVTRGLHSEDRNFCITSLEVLNKLSQIESNEDVLSRSLESIVYKKVCSFLTLHDVMLLIYTLECLYSLSSLGERACNYIVSNHGVVDTLVSLVTVEGKSYGPKACIGMKLVETVPGGTIISAPAVVNSCNNNSSNVTLNVTSTSNITTPPPPPLPPLLPQVQVAPNTPQKVVVTTATTPLRNAHVVPHRMVFTTSSPISLVATTTTSTVPQVTQVSQVSQVVVNSQQLVQQHAHQQTIQENEQFALAWLRATYEPCNSSHIEQQELYKHYINSCAKIGRRGVIAPLHFPRCVRSVFGGSVGPNAIKTGTQPESQYYEGIKVRAQPLIINIQSPPTPQVHTTVKTNVRRKVSVTTNVIPVSSPSPIALNCDSTETPPASPASPILKAQLSAPAKTPREITVITSNACKIDTKSQVMSHPHLSHALLGSNSSTGVVTTTSATCTTTVISPSSTSSALSIVGSNIQQGGQSNTSLIKSLLATKVNECMSSVSMKIVKDCQNVAQVVARQQQQRLLAQQVNTPPSPQTPNNKQQQQEMIKLTETPKSSRINGARQLFCEDVIDSSVSSTTSVSTYASGKREPPQPPPPPLAPLTRTLTPRIDEDSNSTGNNSIASSSGICNVGISSTEDGDNSLTSFEGILLNGVPNIDTLLNDDSNSKDSTTKTNAITKNKPLMLADLLEKKVDKDPPLLNGMLGKELRLSEKGLDLVENHIEKALKSSEKNIAFAAPRSVAENDDSNVMHVDKEVNNGEEVTQAKGTKRPATDDISDTEAKRANVVSVNGSSSVGSPTPESVSSSSNGGDEIEAKGSVSTAAAKLFADIAADILEDEEEEEQFLQEQQQQQQQSVSETPNIVQVVQNSTLQQVYVDSNGQQQMIVASQPRQIILSQPQLPVSNQMVIPGAQGFKPGQTVIVQNTAQQRPQMVIQQANTGQFLLSQGQMQLIPSSTQPGQFVLQAGTTQGAYVVAQSQAAVMHGQPQTVLVAQTPQQQGTGTKTIIILQQPNANATTHHPKVMVAPQGQQMVVTQVQRPVLQTASTISSAPVAPATTVIKTPATSVITPITTVATPATVSVPVSTPVPVPVSVANVEKKEESKTVPKTKQKIVRDLSTPFVCEWGDCQCEIKFKSANQVYMHVCEAHCPETTESEITCQWERCDNMKRKRFSLMTHLYDKHCNTEAMKVAQIKRKQLSQSGKSDPPVTHPATPHPGYAPDAALHAIKRHALEFVNPKELQDDNEGPVTKSIRLTASLILRNLVIYSNNCRRYLRHYEPHLANVALSNVESSRTIAQILYDMNDSAGHR